MAEQELDYHETMALLPAYAAGQLGSAAQAAVDDYLQRQIALFRRLDELEEAAGQAQRTATTMAPKPSAPAQSLQPVQAVQDDSTFTRVMEGQIAPEPDNPLLMRTAPQAYVDEQTGQRYIVPRRAADRNTQTFPGAKPTGSRSQWRTLWSLLALATIAGVALIALYQRNLQQTVNTTQAQLLEVQRQMALVSTANRALSLRANNQPFQGTLLIRDRQAFLTVSGFDRLTEGQRYQLWVRTGDGSLLAAAQLSATDTQNPRWFSIALPVDGNLIVGAAINIEAAGNTTTPTSPMLIESTP